MHLNIEDQYNLNIVLVPKAGVIYLIKVPEAKGCTKKKKRNCFKAQEVQLDQLDTMVSPHIQSK